MTFTARSRNAAGYLDQHGRHDHAYPVGDLYVIADKLSCHTSGPIQVWLWAVTALLGSTSAILEAG